MDSRSYEINVPYYGGGSPEEWLVLKVLLFKDQGISTEVNGYTFAIQLLTGDTKATFNQIAVDMGIFAVDNFNKVPVEMTKHTFSRYAFREHKTYLHSALF